MQRPAPVTEPHKYPVRSAFIVNIGPSPPLAEEAILEVCGDACYEAGPTRGGPPFCPSGNSIAAQLLRRRVFKVFSRRLARTKNSMRAENSLFFNLFFASCRVGSQMGRRGARQCRFVVELGSLGEGPGSTLRGDRKPQLSR